MKRIKNLVGKIFGRWNVKELSEKRGNSNQIYWKCECLCGTSREVIGSLLKNGMSKSCGCLRNENASKKQYKHGHTNSKTYCTWRAMIQRCYNTNDLSYCRYGGKDVKICNRWLGKNGFKNFLEDMGERPKDKSIDRYPNNKGNYEPTNCRWATRREQQQNMKTNLNFTLNGETKCLIEWAREYKIKPTTLTYRLHYLKWDIEKALLEPNQKLIKFYTFNNKTQTLKEWAKELKFKYITLYNRINLYNWSIEKAFTEGKHINKYL